MSITDDATSSGVGGVDERKAAAPPIDLLNCQPDELASWLNAHRFHNNAMDVASFLLTCTAALPNAEEISAHLMGGGGEEVKDDASEADGEANMKQEEPKEETAHTNNSDSKTTANNDDLGEAVPSFSSLEVSCVNPRGKFLLSVHKNGIVFQNPKKTEEQITITKEIVEHTIWFRKPEDYKSLKQLKEGSKKPIPGHMILICLENEAISFRNKALKQICFQLPSYPAPSVETDEDNNEEDWYDGLNSALLSENKSITRVLAKMDTLTCKTTKKAGYMFQAGEGSSGNTSTTTAGMPFVGCNRGFNNGALFPLREGLLFFKPPLFLPRSNLASISCGRGSGQSRFVDMVVQLDDDDSTLEFTNIERDELQGLNGYIHNVLIPAMKKDAVEGSDNGGEDKDMDEDVAVAEVVDSSDEDSASDESSGNHKRKSSRVASKSAREATRAHFAGLPAGEDDEDDEDSDVDPFSEGEDGSDGSDRQSDSELSEMDDDDDDDDDDQSGEEERSDDSDDDDGSFELQRSSKKARVD